MSSNFSELINITNEYVEKIDIFYKELEDIEKQLKTSNPNSFRKQYDTIRNIIDSKKQEINEAENILNMSIKNLNIGKEKVNEVNKLLENMELISNKFKVGTLQGLSNQVVKLNNIKANNEIEENVLENVKLYNELENIHIGGGRHKRRTNKKKYIYKKNKKSKKYRKYAF